MTALSRASFCLFISSRICSAISFRFFTVVPRVLNAAKQLVSKGLALRGNNRSEICLITVNILLQGIEEKLGVHRGHDNALLNFSARVMGKHLNKIEENFVLIVANHDCIGVSAAWVLGHFQLN